MKDIEYEGRAGVMVNNRTHCSCQYLSVYTEKFPSQLCTPFHLLWLCVCVFSRQHSDSLLSL